MPFTYFQGSGVLDLGFIDRAFAVFSVLLSLLRLSDPWLNVALSSMLA